MLCFEQFNSNTLAAGGNQSFFHPQGERVGRVYYKVFCGGCYRYAFVFSDVIDSTFADGSVSRSEDVCGGYTITKLAVGVCDAPGDSPALQPVTFGGAVSYTLQEGETVYTDAVALEAKAGQYLCVEIGFCGNTVPCHTETQIPVFVKVGDRFVPSTEVPLPGMVGCDRAVKHRVAFLGDSITQGIGVEPNSYLHWNAVLAERLGYDNSYWNLGLGFGRAMDAAKNGAWLNKAKHADVVTVCFGVNDIGRGRTAEQIVNDLAFIVKTLQESGCRVLLQTVPPFEYSDENRAKWIQINHALRTEVRPLADAFFDVESVLGDNSSRFGGHPNAEGCRLWAERLEKPLADLINNLDK
jgi:lysophospholipase L1-like esterase